MSQLSAANKRFITKRLIPFILRENGRGFMMESWVLTLRKGQLFTMDDIRRRAPKCNTAACIGGSIALLKHFGTPKRVNFTQAGAAIGLNRVQAANLFSTSLEGLPVYWPFEFYRRYVAANTPLKKAKVAVALLQKIVAEGPDFLPDFLVPPEPMAP